MQLMPMLYWICEKKKKKITAVSREEVLPKLILASIALEFSKGFWFNTFTELNKYISLHSYKNMSLTLDIINFKIL